MLANTYYGTELTQSLIILASTSLWVEPPPARWTYAPWWSTLYFFLRLTGVSRSIGMAPRPSWSSKWILMKVHVTHLASQLDLAQEWNVSCRQAMAMEWCNDGATSWLDRCVTFYVIPILFLYNTYWHLTRRAFSISWFVIMVWNNDCFVLPPKIWLAIK